MTCSEQDHSMSVEQIERNLQLAQQTGLWPIDLWGGEWWYWRATVHKDPAPWQAVQKATQQKP